MQSKLLILVLFFGLTSFSSCKKTSNLTWLYYDETGCNNFWMNFTPISTESELIEVVIDYLDSKEIKVLKIKILKDGNREACRACNCKTGRRIHIQVRNSDMNKAKEKGFYQ